MKKEKGFSLIELLIAVAIVGIIAKIAYPSYLENVRQAKRKEAEAALISLANALEMWRMQNGGSYNANSPTAAGLISATVPVDHARTATYNLSISAVAANTYTLSAAPIQSDPTCGTLTLDQAGTKLPANCW